MSNDVASIDVSQLKLSSLGKNFKILYLVMLFY